MKNNPDVKFYDTCSLLLIGEKLFEKDEVFVISSVTLKELERIKTASNKDEDTKYSARLLLRLLNQYPDRYDTIIHKIDHEKVIIDCNIDITDDTRILSDAIHANNSKYMDRIIFITNDLSLKKISSLFFGDGMIESVDDDTDDYCGYVE